MARSDDTNRTDRRHPSETDARPTRVGRYVVLGTLARGGMGEVLRARAIGAAGATKEVCIKRIRASRLGDRRAVERFVHEARLSLSLTHANIVATFDFGRADHDYYLAMEWIDGADLGRILARAADEPLSLGVIAHVGAEVARALRHAHGASEAAIVHCDVKPSNVLVSRSGDVKLADFGVAVARLEDHRGGTPRYTAPEVRDGGPVTPAADLYALGIVLGELLEVSVRVEAEGTLGEVSRALHELAHSLRSPSAEARPRAAEIVSRLEELGARARVAGELSPRDDLGARAGRVSPSIEREPQESELDPDASYLRDGDSQLETRLTATATSAPETPTRPQRSPVLLVVAALAAAIAALIAWPSGAPDRAGGASTSVPAGATQAAADPASGTVELAPTRELDSESTTLAPTPSTEPTTSMEPTTSTEPTTSEPTSVGAGTARETTRTPATETDSEAATVGASIESALARSLAARREARRPRETGPSAEAEATSPTPSEVAPVDQSPATLRINATPWANVEIDGRLVGPTPLVHVEVAPGEHTIVLTNPVLSRSRTTRVEVRAGEVRDVIVAM